MHYRGSKNSTFRHLINQIPPHSTTVELFAGSAALLRNLRPALATIAVDVDGQALDQLADHLPETELRHECALTWLKCNQHRIEPDWFIYADPPYLMDVRSSQRNYYRHEFATTGEHMALLQQLQQLDCMVMVSGYWHPLYEMQIGDWRTITYTGQTQAGPREEWLWMNYPEPDALHDYRYLGQNFRERERIKRKINRWTDRLQSMDRLERQALLIALQARQK
jgi:DNA adenine methylase